ncbi:hypothetical protein LPJ61_004352 [Coemansia biformis]|uniref:tRNA(Ile)-lysidine synthetase n=1 Tax=Coemansia biformis TaxID=1286918 RepID=A0A9W7YAZ8_9FUNG|nr:hypothetical protein LPJ61_004352 [Coemansia biformis]
MASTAQAIGRTRSLLERLGLADKRLLLAVSGGADSMALAYLVGRAIGPEKCYALTVDHGFRPESAREARDVGRFMRDLGIRHETRALSWGPCPETSAAGGASVALPPVQRLEEVARQRRYAEIGRVCRERRIHTVLTGHHAGDQAETFLFRLLRQSGVYGLAGMSVQSALPVGGCQHEASGPAPVIVRPLLALDKAALYEICRERGIRWHEDASNSDTRFRRNMLREVIAAAGEGQSPFSAQALLGVCRAMQGHREYINTEVAGLLAEHARFSADLGVAELAARSGGGRRRPRWACNPALRERVLASIVGWVNCRDHPPELAHLRQFEQAIAGFYGGERGPPAPAAMAVAASVAMLPPTARRGWLFCRQAPRPAEIPPCVGLALGSTALWDGRLAVRVCERPRSAHPDALTWSIHSLHDAMQRWPECIAAHRSACRRGAVPAERLHAVQATLPVVSVGAGGGMLPDTVVHALGRPVAGSLAAACLDVAVCSRAGAAPAGADEVVCL